MDRALELGINFFDTADVYGWGGEQGDTEELLGRWFAQGGGRRDAVGLAPTPSRYSSGASSNWWPTGFRVPRRPFRGSRASGGRAGAG
jgi:aryl-alcohol dehydrogenase-like predicted oxidoreductase